MGLGFGKQVMNGSDIVQCHMPYTGNSAIDKFVCNDRYASGQSLPPLDITKSTIDIATGIAKKLTNDNRVLASFEAIFDRPCNTNDA